MAGQTKNAAPRSSGAMRSSTVESTALALAGPRWLLLVVVCALVLLGLVMVYSASSVEAISEGSDPLSYVLKQAIAAVVGIACLIALWKWIPYRVWTGWPLWLVWGFAIFLLIITPFVGSEELGATRWIAIGSALTIQPSEFAKIALVLMMARIIFDFRNGDLGLRDLVVQILLLVIVPLLFLYRTQSDLGTTLICAIGILAVLWAGEVPLRWILAILAVGVVFVLLFALSGYREDRLVFLDPWNDGEDGYGSGYQLIHSFYAFAEGGLFGVGLGNSREKFLYLPEAETDFIFAIIGEELGLIGALVVVLLYLLFLYAGIRIARGAADPFGRIIAESLTVMLVFQAFLNICCVIGLLPTTGKPLPFVSSGASSLLASLITVGLLLAVSEGNGIINVYDQRRSDLRLVRVGYSEDNMHEPTKAAPRRRR